MELTSDLIGIQSILSSLKKNVGEFTKINYRGGNEEKILTAVIEIQKFLSTKNYIRDGKIDPTFDRQLEDIVLFLAINTTYKSSIQLDNYMHLVGIIPSLSKCLFAHIVYGLDLIKYYCTVIEKLPIAVSAELMDEANQCLKKSLPKIQLEYTSMFLKAARDKLAITESCKQIEDDVYNLSEATNTMLLNLSGFNSEHIKDLKASEIHQHMGHCLLNLFNLLLDCDVVCELLQPFIKNLLRTCCCIIQNVTISVYCDWAEIYEEDEPLQGVISGKAYLLIEKYNKHNSAKDLIHMLGPMARKPRTVAEQIRSADTALIIKKINMGDQNQQQWFQALIYNFQISQNDDALRCINKWVQLCTENDVILLLNVYTKCNIAKLKTVILKAAANLDPEKLVLVLTKHFYRNTFGVVLNEDVGPEITLLFNKLNENNKLEKDLMVEVGLLMLQNPKQTFSYIYKECITNPFYTTRLMDIFKAFKEISSIARIGINTLESVMENNIPDAQNVKSYIELFRILISLGYFTDDLVWLNILYPFLKRLSLEHNIEGISYTLQTVVDSNIRIQIQSGNMESIGFLLELMTEFRCKFIDFNSTKQQIVKYLVDIVVDHCQVYPGDKISLNNEDSFSGYYRKQLTGDADLTFFKSLCTDFNINNHGDCVTKMLKFLPSCVTKEWLSITFELINLGNAEKCLELFTDVLTLLSHLVETQVSNNDVDKMYASLKYCVQNFGIVIQQKLKNDKLETEMVINRQVCRLLTRLPDVLKEEEGLSLVNLLSEGSLKSMANDKEFLCLLLLIKNPIICKTLAQKITN